MDWSVILKVLGFFLVTALVIRLIFKSFVLTRILSFACSGYLLYLCLTTDVAARDAQGILFTILTALGWLFYLGEAVFETAPMLHIFDWEGVEWEIVSDSGGILSHSILSMVVCGILYFLAPKFPPLYFILSGGLVGLNAISCFTGGPVVGD